MPVAILPQDRRDLSKDDSLVRIQVTDKNLGVPGKLTDVVHDDVDVGNVFPLDRPTWLEAPAQSGEPKDRPRNWPPKRFVRRRRGNGIAS